jgi:hypothetical protein
LENVGRKTVNVEVTRKIESNIRKECGREGLGSCYEDEEHIKTDEFQDKPS